MDNIESLKKENAELKEINESLHRSSKFTYENQTTEIESLKNRISELEEENKIIADYAKEINQMYLDDDIFVVKNYEGYYTDKFDSFVMTVQFD